MLKLTSAEDQLMEKKGVIIPRPRHGHKNFTAKSQVTQNESFF